VEVLIAAVIAAITFDGISSALLFTNTGDLSSGIEFTNRISKLPIPTTKANTKPTVTMPISNKVIPVDISSDIVFTFLEHQICVILFEMERK
jgi:hypothetical protein